MRHIVYNKFIRVFILMVAISFILPISLYASFVDDAYKEIRMLDKSKAKRSSYIKIADNMFRVYMNNPNGAQADSALLASARIYKITNDRFKVREDLDKSLKNYRILQNSFTTDISRDAYIECADIYIKLKDTASAKFILNKLINKYPKSAQTVKAEQKMIALNKANPTFIPKSTTAKSKKATENANKVAVKDTIRRITEQPVAIMAEPKDEVKTGNVTINGIRYFSDKDYTRVVIDISETAKYESHWIKEDTSNKKPPRLTIDIPSSSLSPNLKKDLTIKDGLLSSVRVGYHAPEKRTRIVLDSENVKDFTVFQMPNPNRIVVDVFSQSRVANAGNINNKPIDKKSPDKQDNKKQIADKSDKEDNDKDDDIQMTLGSALGLKIKTIVIDAGHGGKDPGAMYSKLREKDIVLDIALKLRDLLKRDKSLKIYMTRDKDIFIPLEERTAIANKYKADLFVSIHANAARNNRASGVETFVFNVTNDKAALEVASFENQATTKSISDLQGILKDILKYSKLEESLLLAGSVQKKLATEINLTKNQNLGVKQAPFYVLVGATMPSILVETGFLSNANDAKRLSTEQHRKDVAEGIYKGLTYYISKYNR